jgi:hypothetical protein
MVSSPQGFGGAWKNMGVGINLGRSTSCSCHCRIMAKGVSRTMAGGVERRRDGKEWAKKGGYTEPDGGTDG